MSTLKVGTIADTSGSTTSTPEQIEAGRIKAWVAFNGTGSISVLDSYRVSSITDTATGRYTVNWQDTQANTNYCISGIAQEYATGDTARTKGISLHNSTDSRTTTATKIALGWVGNNDSGTVDSPYVSIQLCN